MIDLRVIFCTNVTFKGIHVANWLDQQVDRTSTGGCGGKPRQPRPTYGNIFHASKCGNGCG